MQIHSRFDDVDAQTGETLGLLRNVENQRTFIRSNRNWLYRSQLAWEPVLDRWVRSGHLEEEFSGLLAATYHFLASRFMPTTTWHKPRQTRKRTQAPNHMTW